MSLPSTRRVRHLRGVTLVATAVIIVACGGSSSQVGPAATSTDTDGGATGATGATGSTGSTGSTGPTGSNGPDGSVVGSSGPDGSLPPNEEPDGATITPLDGAACPAKGTEVVMIGDSYFALSGEITTHLESLTTAAGALASGDAYRHYYASGANMYPYPGSLVPPIPTQFNTAVTASADIKYVLMDGGGNDILLQNPDCIDVSPDAGPISAACLTVIQNGISTATTLFGTMQTAGVQKIVYFFYPHLPTTGKPSVNVIIDYAYPLIEAACQSSPVPCYLIDTRPSFEGHPEYIGPDNIHPTTAGSDVIAGLIWGVMQQECVALSP